jgi:hypothetical protein
VPDDQPPPQPQDQPPPPAPLDYHPSSISTSLVGRLLVIAVWLILSGIVIFYLIRMFRTP